MAQTKQRRARRSAAEMAAARAAGLAPPKQIRVRSPGKAQHGVPNAEASRRGRKSNAATAADAGSAPASPLQMAVLSFAHDELLPADYVMQFFHHYEDVRLSVWVDVQNSGLTTYGAWLEYAEDEMQHAHVHGWRIVRVVEDHS